MTLRRQITLRVEGDVVVKTRPLRPVEEVETPVVLRRLMQVEEPALCPVLGFKVDRAGVLTVRLRHVPGTDLRHDHDRHGRNTARSAADLTRPSPDQRLRRSAQVIDAVATLHANGIVYGDLKIEQLRITDDGSVVLLDVDEVAIEGSALADHPVLGSPLDPFVGLPSTRLTDQWRLGRLIHELFVGQHLHPSARFPPSEAGDGITFLVALLLSPDLVDLRGVASALRTFRDGVPVIPDVGRTTDECRGPLRSDPA